MHIHSDQPTSAAMPTASLGTDAKHLLTLIASNQTRPATTRREEAPSAGWYDRPRTLHLVDLENLLAGRVDAGSVTELWAEYQFVTGMRDDDHVIVSVAQRNAVASFFSLPSAIQRVIGSNAPDGADHALLDSIDIAWTARRFGQVMVATGDGIFTPIASRLRAQGLQMVQVIGGGTPATSLYRQCTTQLYLTNAQHRARRRRPIRCCSRLLIPDQQSRDSKYSTIAMSVIDAMLIERSPVS
ncbi:NYN domain-containing protein [Rhodococcoides kyotonense]|uniref:NYN domain-containing protein n=1 Tax=Rhodococcoides kyotonense TaxID=398843 RepID=A0A177YBU0_9NOCA|nr:NYN domain-containing protein [Rhodococcus kyotonensis]OAK52984.1 hypothetical protein A3K89_24220 [Rhodococcus kyotonensis]